ncbi:hypothetical protein LTR12_016340 [Friedmanniomyces endolithicus]|nr:hypothetical protein LTR12_016340 [Friedmanniomyces endolithicus]
MLNTLENTRTMRADFGEIPGLQAGGRYKVDNAWTGGMWIVHRWRLWEAQCSREEGVAVVVRREAAWLGQRRIPVRKVAKVT